MTSLKDHIARDLQRKLNDDVARALTRVIDLAPQDHYLALSLQAVCTTLDLSAQVMESEHGFGTGARHLSVYLVALMAAHAYASNEPVFNDALAMRAQDDMKRLGLLPARSGAKANVDH
jgi:hypothetical protein